MEAITLSPALNYEEPLTTSPTWEHERPAMIPSPPT